MEAKKALKRLRSVEALQECSAFTALTLFGA